jgi:flavin reductase (DIM6/NTAB) family NADH-FMN oxidoreductase RutF
MLFDLRALPKASRYKIMGSAIAPRPIAWVTTLSAQGVPNAAPYSFFNMMGDAPPTIALGLLSGASGGAKNTAENIIATGEFVVHTVTEADAEAMNITCMDAPAGVDELVCAGIATVPSTIVAPPRIPTAPAAFECRTLHRIETGPGQNVIIGEVLAAHIADAFILDAERLHFDTPAMQLVSRLHGSGWYGRQTDLFQMARPTYAEWLAAEKPIV